MGLVARFGVYVETIGTFGAFLALAFLGFHQGFGFVFTTQGVEHLKTNPLGLDFRGNWWTGALVAVLARLHLLRLRIGRRHLRRDQAQRQVPRAMRSALIYGGIVSFVLCAGCCSRCRPRSDRRPWSAGA